MSKKSISLKLVLTIAVVALAGQANATLYNGGDFSLTLLSETSGSTGTTYEILYTADLTNWDDSTAQDYISAIGFKLAAPDPTSFSLISTNASSISNWSNFSGGVNANGCSGSGSGFICSELVSNLLLVPTDNPTSTPYTWTYELTYASAISNFDASIKALFVDKKGKHKGLLSENTTVQTPVPEPATMGLLGMGLAGIGVLRRRKRATT